MLALITGASSGIGRDMARILAIKGYDLALVARNQEGLDKIKAELERENVNIKMLYGFGNSSRFIRFGYKRKFI